MFCVCARDAVETERNEKKAFAMLSSGRGMKTGGVGQDEGRAQEAVQADESATGVCGAGQIV